MYGGLDRSSIPRLKKGDEKFIADVTAEFGSRQVAARAWINQAFRFHQSDNTKKAMQRFNQAWLLDPNNPEVYWGFSAILYEQGDNCGSMQMGQKALAFGLDSMIPSNQAMFLADLAMVTSICAIDESKEHANTETLIREADELFARSEGIWPSAYLYDKWWQGLYWRGEYDDAWEKVSLMREQGGEPQAEYLKMLKAKLAEP